MCLFKQCASQLKFNCNRFSHSREKWWKWKAVWSYTAVYKRKHSRNCGGRGGERHEGKKANPQSCAAAQPGCPDPVGAACFQSRWLVSDTSTDRNKSSCCWKGYCFPSQQMSSHTHCGMRDGIILHTTVPFAFTTSSRSAGETPKAGLRGISRKILKTKPFWHPKSLEAQRFGLRKNSPLHVTWRSSQHPVQLWIFLFIRVTQVLPSFIPGGFWMSMRNWSKEIIQPEWVKIPGPSLHIQVIPKYP